MRPNIQNHKQQIKKQNIDYGIPIILIRIAQMSLRKV